MTVNRYIFVFAGIFILLSLALGIEGSPLFVSKWALAFTAFVGLNLFQSGFTNFCPLAIILRKLGAGVQGRMCQLSAGITMAELKTRHAQTDVLTVCAGPRGRSAASRVVEEGESCLKDWAAVRGCSQRVGQHLPAHDRVLHGAGVGGPNPTN
jgi:hypothetical protein